MQQQPSGEPRNPYLRAGSLAELLSWHDLDFIRCAYVTVLGRQPDSPGEAYFTSLLRSGRSKLEILYYLRISTEASLHDPGIAGFDRALNRAKWERNRYFGRLVSFFTKGDETNSVSARRHRVLLNEVHRAAADMNAIISKSITTEFQTLRNDVKMLQGRVAALGSTSRAVEISRTSSSTAKIEQMLATSETSITPASSKRIFRKLLEH